MNQSFQPTKLLQNFQQKDLQKPKLYHPICKGFGHDQIPIFSWTQSEPPQKKTNVMEPYSHHLDNKFCYYIYIKNTPKAPEKSEE